MKLRFPSISENGIGIHFYHSFIAWITSLGKQNTRTRLKLLGVVKKIVLHVA